MFFCFACCTLFATIDQRKKKKGKEKEKKISCNRANKFENYYVFQNSRFLGPSVTFVQQAIKRRKIPVEEVAYVTPLVAYNMLVAVFICLAFIKNEITRFLLFFFCFLVDMKSERQNWKFIPNIY